MIENLRNSATVKRLFSSFAVVAVLCVMTGPPGSTTTPMAGITGSFNDPASFFGLFTGKRWMVFFVFALVFFGVWSLWLARGPQIKRTVSHSLATPKSVMERPPVRVGLYTVYLG